MNRSGSGKKPLKAQRGRLIFFPLIAISIFVTLYVLYSIISTLHQLDIVESERDRWQRPSDVIRALDLREGDSVVDLGSGAGYFALKLSQSVGSRGQVVAVDLRRLSLLFLWSRRFLHGRRNVHVVVGQEDNPHLPASAVDAVLICNTYHEISHSQPVLKHVFESLRVGGRLVVVDRGRGASEAQHAHEAPLTVVRDELRRNQFEIVAQDDHFISRPGDDLWWLLIARKP